MVCVLAQWGGNWNNGANAGLSYWNLNNTSSNANVNLGGRPLVSMRMNRKGTPYSSPLGENQAAQSRV